MIKHLFKLIWNKKKENFLLISEVLVSFMVMFAIVSMLLYYFQNYRVSDGFEAEHVWVVALYNPVQSQDKDSVVMAHETLKNAIMSQPKVKGVSYSADNVPYSHSTNMTGLFYEKAAATSDYFVADQDYDKVMNIKMAAGRWFNSTDKTGIHIPIVLNSSAVKELGISGNPIGEIIRIDKKDEVVVGVMQDMKDEGTYKRTGLGIFNMVDTSNVRGLSTLLIKVAPDADAGFENKLYQLIASNSKSANLQITHLPDMRTSKDKEVIIPLIILVIIATFLIVNVALGLFGVLWYNISKRRGEIGLRRAIGASASGVSGQLVREALVLATFSLTIGVFFAVQFPLLHVFDLPVSVYIIAMVLSVLFIYVLVVVCALYPGKQAAAIHPAVALHED